MSDIENIDSLILPSLTPPPAPSQRAGETKQGQGLLDKVDPAIKSRQEKKDVLSWIENFGLHLFEEDCKPHVPFQNGETDMVLVLRIRNKHDSRSVDGVSPTSTITAYLCSFKTMGGFTKFCINAACEEDVDGLKELMTDKAKWTDENTRNWWKEVFRDLKHPIDEDILKHQAVLVSDSLHMNMMDFIEKIQELVGKAISKLGIDKQIISKVCVVEQFAMALPFRYAIARMFPNAKDNVFPFVWKEKKMSWLQNSSRFHVPGKLLHTALLTSPQISIGDILNQEKGIEITLPLSKTEDNTYRLPSTPVIDNLDLRWDDLPAPAGLHPGHLLPDYEVDGLAFKRYRLSMFADGFQNIFVNGLPLPTNRYGRDGLSDRLSKAQTSVSAAVPAGRQDRQSRQGAGATPLLRQGGAGVVGQNTPSDEARHQIATLFFDGSDRFIIVARKNIEALFKKKYEDKWKEEWENTFCRGVYRNLDFGNFPDFIRTNKEELVKYWGSEDAYFQVKNSVYALHKLRNKNNHHEIDSVIDQGKAEVSRVFSDMIRVVKIMDALETAEKIEELNIKLDTIWWI